MSIESGKYDESLKDIVKEYYVFSNKEEKTKYVPVIDDCCYDIIFFKEANTTLTYGSNQKEIEIPYHIFTIHNLVPPYKLKFKESLNFFTIKLQPWANACFFSNLKEQGIHNLEDNDKYRRFFQEVFFLHTNSEKFELADRLMKKQEVTLSTNAEFVKDVCLFIYERRGLVSVNEISDTFQKSRQYIGKLFKQNVLYGLKRFITTVRIVDLVKHRKDHEGISLTELSYQYNYFDQSHFIRDFKQVCGVTPTVFFDDLPKFLLRH